MKTRLIPILAAIAAASLSVLSCTPQAISADTADISVDFAMQEVHDGGTFTFRVHSNHEKVIVTKYSCEFGTKDNGSTELYLNKEYDVDSSTGFWTFVTEDIEVDSDHWSNFSITLKDPATGFVKEFGPFRFFAYASLDVDVKVNNKAILPDIRTYFENSDALPTVVGGDDFSFTVTCTDHDELTLKEFTSPFNDGQLKAGGRWNFAKNKGSIKVTMPGVSVREDQVDEPAVFSLTFEDESTGKLVKTQEVKMYLVTPFEAKIKPADGKKVYVNDGTNLDVEITTNRKKVQALMPSFSRNPEFKDAYSYVFSNGGKADFSVDPYNGTMHIKGDVVSVANSVNGTVTVAVYDSYYTNRELVLTCPYMAVEPEHDDPSIEPKLIEKTWVDIGEEQVDNSSFVFEIKGKGSNIVPQIVTGKDNKHTGSVKASYDSATGVLSVYGIESGPAKVLLRHPENIDVTYQLELYVRHPVVMMVTGVFDHGEYSLPYDYQWKNDATGGNYIIKKEGEKVISGMGFYHIPKSLKVGLYKIIPNDSGYYSDTAFESVDRTQVHSRFNFQPLSLDINCSVSFALSVSPSVREDKFDFLGHAFYDAYSTKRWNTSLLSALSLSIDVMDKVFPSPGSLWTASREKSPFLHTEYQVKYAQGAYWKGGEYSLRGVDAVDMEMERAALITYDDLWHGRVAYSHDYIWNPERFTTRWTTFDIVPDSVEYDDTKLNLKYIMFDYKTNKSGASGSGVEDLITGDYWWRYCSNINVWRYKVDDYMRR